MGGNPKKSRWRSTPQEARGRLKAGFTLPPDVLAALDAESKREAASKSELVERALRQLLRIPLHT